MSENKSDYELKELGIEYTKEGIPVLGIGIEYNYLDEKNEKTIKYFEIGIYEPIKKMHYIDINTKTGKIEKKEIQKQQIIA